MSTLDEQWLQDVAESLKIQALNPTLCKMLLPVIEIQVKKITQQAHKFQRRSKSNSVTVDDVNSALAMNKIEPVYGLSRTEPSIALEAASVTSASAMTKAGISSKQPTSGKFLNLVEYGKASSISLAVPCPLLPEVSLHWLAVHGSQPLTADNPSTATTVGTMNADDQPLTLPKELQHLYARITGIILSAGGPAGMYSSSSSTPAPTGTGKLTAMGGAKSSAQFGSLGSMVGSSSSSGGGSASGLDAVLSVLQTDASIQLLTPYLSRFFYRHIKASTKRVGLLRTMITCIRSLLENPLVNLEFHLQQLLPAIFTCNVAAKLSGSPHEDHWSLRRLAADVIAKINHKFGDQFPELQARICKTFLYALDSDKSLPTVYGGLVGLAALGPEVVRSLLLSRSSYSSSSSSSSSGGGGTDSSKRAASTTTSSNEHQVSNKPKKQKTEQKATTAATATATAKKPKKDKEEEVVEWTTDHDSIGRRVAKHFWVDGKWEVFGGTVVRFALPSRPNRHDHLYHIFWDDEDEADFDEAELQAGLLLLETLMPTSLIRAPPHLNMPQPRQAVFRHELLVAAADSLPNSSSSSSSSSSAAAATATATISTADAAADTATAAITTADTAVAAVDTVGGTEGVEKGTGQYASGLQPPQRENFMMDVAADTVVAAADTVVAAVAAADTFVAADPTTTTTTTETAVPSAATTETAVPSAAVGDAEDEVQVELEAEEEEVLVVDVPRPPPVVVDLLVTAADSSSSTHNIDSKPNTGVAAAGGAVDAVGTSDAGSSDGTTAQPETTPEFNSSVTGPGTGVNVSTATNAVVGMPPVTTNSSGTGSASVIISTQPPTQMPPLPHDKQLQHP